MNTGLTVLENFSFTAEVARSMAQLNEAKYPILAVPSSRIIGFVSIPFAGVADTFAHLFLATGKVATGVIISPYNTFAVTFCPRMAASVDLELSSALVHLMRVIQSLFDAVTLPFICLLNPARAHKMTSHRLPQQASSEAEGQPDLEREREKSEQEAEIQELTNRLQELERQYLDLETEPQQQPPLTVPLNPQRQPIDDTPPPPSPRTHTQTDTTPPSPREMPPRNPPPHPSMMPPRNPPQPPPTTPIPRASTTLGTGNPPRNSSIGGQPTGDSQQGNNAELTQPQDLLAQIRLGKTLRATPRFEIPTQLIPSHEEILSDNVKFGLFSRTRDVFDDMLTDLHWLEANNGDQEKVTSILNNELVKDLVKNKVTFTKGEIKALITYFELFQKKVEAKTEENLERRRLEQEEAARLEALKPKPVVQPVETPLAKKQRELLEELAIKDSHDLSGMIGSLTTVKKGRLSQNFRNANSQIHVKDQFKDLETFITKYDAMILKINGMQDLTGFDSDSDFDSESIRNVRSILGALKDVLEK